MEFKNQISDLVSGNLTREQREKLLTAINEDENLRREFYDAKISLSLNYNNNPEDLNIENSYLEFTKLIRKSARIKTLYHLFKYAAAVLIIFSMGYLLNHFHSQEKMVYTELTVPNGEKAELTLADGSRVWLNSGSTFKFPSSFQGKKREVILSGEGYFEIKKGRVPFIISTRSGDIEVLGTSFNVRAYENMEFQTTLAEGKIQFKTAEEKKILEPGQQLLLTKEGKIVVKNVDSSLAPSWREGAFTFDQEPFADVVKKMERHFNITIILSHELDQVCFTGRIFNESIMEVMNYINKTKPIHYSYDKDHRQLRITSRE